MIRKLLPITTIIISILAPWWFASDTHWNLFPEDLSAYYENHGKRLLEGRFDVECWAIKDETLLKDGRCYGYFGPFPALIRVLLSALFPNNAYHWTLFSLLCAILLTLLVSWRLISNTLTVITTISTNERLFIECLLLINIGLGSSLLTLSSPPFLYHEAIVWSSAFVLAASFALLRYLNEMKLRHALLAAGMSLLAVITRANVGFGAIAMLLFTFFPAILLSFKNKINYRLKLANIFGVDKILYNNKRHLLIMVLLLFVAATPYAISYAKFGEFLLLPLKYHIEISSTRMVRTHGYATHPGNILFNLKHYINPFGISASSVFPYIKLAPRDWGWRESPDVHFDRGEPFMPLPDSMPLWVIILTPAGLYGIARGLPTLRKRTNIVLGTIMGGSTIFVFVGITPRYIHDFFPFLLISGTAGLSWLATLSRRGRIRLYIIAFCLTIIGIYTNFSLCMLNVFVREGVVNVRTQLRGKMDGILLKTNVVDYNSQFAANGISMSLSGKWRGVVLPKHIASGFSKRIPVAFSGFAKGTRIDFASSGPRYVTGFTELGDKVIVWVDGPLDPSKDGAPAFIEYRTDPCGNMNCGDTKADM